MGFIGDSETEAPVNNCRKRQAEEIGRSSSMITDFIAYSHLSRLGILPWTGARKESKAERILVECAAMVPWRASRD
jgi:hypothetical protein